MQAFYLRDRLQFNRSNYDKIEACKTENRDCLKDNFRTESFDH